MIIANVACWGRIGIRNFAYKQLVHPHVAPPSSALMWAFPSPPDAPEARRIHFPTSSPESTSILEWFDKHQTGWVFSSTRFSPDRTQLVSDSFAIELLEHRIILAYQPTNDSDPYDHATIERILSDSERETWSTLVKQIGLKNRAE
jgi:hypothetical protein